MNDIHNKRTNNRFTRIFLAAVMTASIGFCAIGSPAPASAQVVPVVNLNNSPGGPAWEQKWILHMQTQYASQMHYLQNMYVQIEQYTNLLSQLYTAYNILDNQVARIEMIKREHLPLPAYLVAQAQAIQGTINTTSYNIDAVKSTIAAMKKKGPTANTQAASQAATDTVDLASSVGQAEAKDNIDLQQIQNSAGPGATDKQVSEASLQMQEMQAENLIRMNTLLAQKIALEERQLQAQQAIDRNSNAQLHQSSKAMQDYFNGPIQVPPPPASQPK